MAIELALAGMIIAFLCGAVIMACFKVSGSHSCIECDYRAMTVNQSNAEAGDDIVGGNKHVR